MATADDTHNLERFVTAQNTVIDDVIAELRNGRKESHWMWFVFPQLRGLGSSPMANKYGISSLEEAQAYLQHPILGPRLRECTRLVNLVDSRSIEQIFGYPDDMKFRSSMTLFAHATADNEAFVRALEKYFDGKPDSKTIKTLERL